MLISRVLKLDKYNMRFLYGNACIAYSSHSESFILGFIVVDSRSGASVAVSSTKRLELSALSREHSATRTCDQNVRTILLRS